MRPFARPRIVVSRCLGFAACRHDGAKLSSPFVRKLQGFANLTTVCPEVEIGLGTPRDPIRIVRNGTERLVQPATGLDLTDRMHDFAREFLDGLGVPEGFVLKSRSPSCAVSDTKLWTAAEGGQPVARGPGVFGRQVLERHAGVPVVDEGQLNNFTIREHFYTAIFLLADFRDTAAAGTMKALIDFHSRHKLLLLAICESGMRELGRIVANHRGAPAQTCHVDYGRELRAALPQPPPFTRHVNVLQHGLGFFKRLLAKHEIHHFLEVLEQYRAGVLPLSTPTGLLRALIVRFGQPVLAAQSYFRPYPEALIEITDSGKGRGA